MANVCNGGIDNGGLGWVANLREIREECREVLQSDELCVARQGNMYVLTKNRPFKVSRRWRSTALWVALHSAVLALLLGFLFIWPLGTFALCDGWFG
jgi:hypothetical protein